MLIVEKQKSPANSAMSISSMLGASDPPSMSLPPINSGGGGLPSLSRPSEKTSNGNNNSNNNNNEGRQSAFISHQTGPGAPPTFSLPPMTQFDPAMDRRRQNPLESPPLRAEDAVARLKKMNNNTAGGADYFDSEHQQKTATAAAGKKHSHHSHHHHHHHHSHSHSHPHHHRHHSIPSVEPPKTGHAEVVVNSEDVLEAAKKFPRKQLGTVVYCPQVHDHVLLPRMEGQENSLLQVRIARRYLDKNTNPSVNKRRLWGTDVYTDDSDVVAALYHCGYLDKPQEPVEDVAVKKGGRGKKRTASPSENTNNNTDHSKDGDCIATILILPRLAKYRGSTRNGLNSRSWLTRHDGVSFKIEKVEFINKGQAEAIPALKKQRLQEWHYMRRQIQTSYPSFTFDKSRAKNILNRPKQDDQPTAAA